MSVLTPTLSTSPTDAVPLKLKPRLYILPSVSVVLATLIEVGIDDVRFEILTEVKLESSNFGMKPRGSVNVSKKGVTTKHTWTLNQQNTNFLIDSFGDESASWIGKSVGVFVENIKGNNAIRIKA